jgi:1-aminocyclopropane-1-carboxylate deaminase/D-cysteine desulfhydrase-like pyridoxal-dependent ACC family enzyme
MGTELVGNLLLDTIFGAEVTFTSRTDPWDPAIADELGTIAAGYVRQGRRPQVIQLTGASASIGIAGWIAGAAELVRDFEAIGAVPDIIVVVCGSGLTLAGLALGFKHLGCRTRLVGVSAQQPAGRLKVWIVQAAASATEHLQLAVQLSEDDFDIIDNEIAPGYGLPSTASVAAVRLAGWTEGIVFDPVYTGKGLAGVATGLRSGLIPASSSMVFLHSGGTPGLFAHSAAFHASDAV